MSDIRQSIDYSKHLKNTGWVVERVKEINYFIKKVPMLGNVVKIQRPVIIRHQDIGTLIKKHKPWQVIIEPSDPNQVSELEALNFKLSKLPYLPTKTLILNLTPPLSQILKNMKNDARSAIKKTEKLEVKKVIELEEFRKSWKSAIGWRLSVPSLKDLESLKKSFGKDWLIIGSCSNDSNYRVKYEAGAVFLIADNKAYYWKAFTTTGGRTKLAQYKIVWEGIQWAKKMGAKVFDFEGIYDERFPINSWKGFTHFKKSFGGRKIEYPGCFTKTSLRNFIKL